AGGFLGGVIVWLAYLPHWKATPDPVSKLAVFSTTPAIRQPLANLLSEIIGGFALVLALLAVISPGNFVPGSDLAKGFGPILVGAQKEFPQIFPKPGWVEHNPRDIWSTQMGVAAEVLTKAHVTAADVAAIGITNQRETTVVWDRVTGEPIYNAIVWQDRRTA